MDRRPATRFALTIAVVLCILPTAAHATLTFRQLDDDVFVVSHRVKIIGSRGKAMDMALTKTASLCIAAGYSHLEILQEDSQASQTNDAANASIRARFHLASGTDRIDCGRSAEQSYIEEASAKLARRGYRRPDTTAAPAAAGAAATDSGAHNCSLEQIATMARAGLSDDQIRAACKDGQ